MYSKRKELDNEPFLLSRMSKTENDSCAKHLYCQPEKNGLWDRCSGFQKNKSGKNDCSRRK